MIYEYKAMEWLRSLKIALFADKRRELKLDQDPSALKNI